MWRGGGQGDNFLPGTTLLSTESNETRLFANAAALPERTRDVYYEYNNIMNAVRILFT